jgi:N,N'-diacetyllegionaminate synthase
MPTHLHLGSRIIGPGHPSFIIAEAGVNHNGDINMAKQLIDKAKEAGADAVKFQTFRADRLVAPGTPLAPYQAARDDAPADQYELIKSLELAHDDHVTLKYYCEKVGILFLSSPFDEDSADLLDAIGVQAYKVPSGEIVNLPFLKHLAKLGRPIILSSGMATFGEIDKALSTIRESGVCEVVLLHCVTAYPTPPDECNLSVMKTLQDAFGVPVGWSDHTAGTAVGIAAAALGACIIEKHFTLDSSLPGPDHQASLEPAQLAEMIENIRTVEAAMGHPTKGPVACEADNFRIIRKGLCARGPITTMKALTPDALDFRRHPDAVGIEHLSDALGRKLRCPLAAGDPVRWQDLV